MSDEKKTEAQACSCACADENEVVNVRQPKCLFDKITISFYSVVCFVMSILLMVIITAATLMRYIFEGMRMANHHAFLDMGMHIKHHATVVPHEQQRQHPLDIVCASPKHTISFRPAKIRIFLKIENCRPVFRYFYYLCISIHFSC